ncbi:MAG TPA: hypothetical protein IGS37_01650, partial [Synechococcales cyanobacterium M55_K2018_004]|nr:hypothetical protein [Synechococcales cyanobacterium M55_K2018_004]
MDLLESFKPTSVVLNRYLVKRLEERDLTVHEYQCHFTQTPQQGDEQRAISRICYKLGVTAVRLGSRIITKEEVNPARMRSDDWNLVKIGPRTLDCGNTYEIKALETFERKVLEQRLKDSYTEIERASEGGLIWWIKGENGLEKCGDGWEVHRGRRIDVVIDSDGNLYL